MKGNTAYSREKSGVSFKTTPDQVERLRAMSAETELPMSYLIRRAIDDLLEKWAATEADDRACFPLLSRGSSI